VRVVDVVYRVLQNSSMADESLSDLVNTAEQHVQEQTDALEQIVADLNELQRTVNTLSNITGEYTVDAPLYQCYT